MISAEYKSAYQQGYSDAMRDFRKEPKTGYWIDRDVYDADRWKCSECGRTEPYKENYCPNCGCRMVDEQEREDKCKNCEYYRNPDYTRCHECETERSE